MKHVRRPLPGRRVSPPLTIRIYVFFWVNKFFRRSEIKREKMMPRVLRDEFTEDSCFIADQYARTYKLGFENSFSMFMDLFCFFFL